MKTVNTLLLSLLLFGANVMAQSFEIGHYTASFYDESRNRNIETEIYYPAEEAGEEVDIASGTFPIIVFAHGFVMDVNAYESYWTEYTPLGYVFCFPRSEMGLSPNHEAFALDLGFIATQMQLEAEDGSSLFFNSLSERTAVMGHSMGGGCTFLAAESNPLITTLVNFAAAETTPSSIVAAANVSIPTLMFSGDDDCVTPPSENQDLMYTSLTSDCKTQISIINGGHCYFADYNFNCSLGESICNPSLDITREEQLSISFSFLMPWLDYTLYDNDNAFEDFNDLLEGSNDINFLQSCINTGWSSIRESNDIDLFPNPAREILNLQVSSEYIGGIVKIYNCIGSLVYTHHVLEDLFQIKLIEFPIGSYFIDYQLDNHRYSAKFFRIK